MHSGHAGSVLSALTEVSHDLTSTSRMRIFHILTQGNVIPSSGRPTPQITCCLPVFYRVVSHIRVSPQKITFTLLITGTSNTYFSHVLARIPPQTLGEDAERGTALRHWDAVGRQSRNAIHPTTWKTRQSRNQTVYLLYSALTQIQTAVNELQM